MEVSILKPRRRSGSRYLRPRSFAAQVIGDWLRDLRLIMGWTQLQVAVLMSEDIPKHVMPPETISRWELGYRVPTIRHRRKLAALYGVPLPIFNRIVRDSDLEVLREYQERVGTS